MSKRTRLILALRKHFITKQIRKNIKLMGIYAAHIRKLERYIEEIIADNKKLRSDLEIVKKELREYE